MLWLLLFYFYYCKITFLLLFYVFSRNDDTVIYIFINLISVQQYLTGKVSPGP